jgi:prepilin peptidase CpaA
LTLFDLIIVAVTSLSVFFDLRVRRIPNWLILFGLVAGFILNVHQGPSRFYYSIIGFLVGVASLIVPFSLGWLGAGDVKYFGVIGAMLGLDLLPRVFFYSAAVAGAMAIMSVLMGRYNLNVLKSAWTEWKIAALSLGYIVPETVNMRVSNGAHALPWGVALGLGTILAHFVDRHGYWAGF